VRAFVCMVLAGDSNNEIPLTKDFIKIRAGLKKAPDIKPLIKSGFAEVVEESKENASKVLQNSPPETETYKEETETERTIGIDAATSKVFLEVGLAGNEARMLCQDSVRAFVHSRKCSFEEAANSLIEIWQQYSSAEIEFKKGVFKFFKEGLWKSPEKWKVNGESRRVTRPQREPSAQVARYHNNLAEVERTFGAAAVARITNPNSAGQEARLSTGNSKTLAGEVGRLQRH
jgi:hypothetical protein